MSFFKSKYNVAMLIIFAVGVIFVFLNSIASIFMPIGLDIIAIAMFMEAANIYNANQERKDMDEVTNRKITFDASKISVDEDVYYVEEDDKKSLLKRKVKKYNNTMSLCITLSVFGFVLIALTVGLYIGLI